MPHPIEILQKLHSDLPEDLIERVRDLMVEEHVKKGYCLEIPRITPGTGRSYYIKKGAARTYYIDKGREYTLSFAFDDDFIITNRLHGVMPSENVGVMFLEDTDMLVFTHSEIHHTIAKEGEQRTNPLEWTMFLNTVLYEYVGYLEDRLFYLYNASARERYDWALKRYPRLGDVATITQIASFLGVTKETLYRIKGGKYRSHS
jgi:hypothetical protein